EMRLACEAAESALQTLRADLSETRARAEALERDAMECALGCERARTLAGELGRNFAEKFHTEFAAVEGELSAALAERDAVADDVLEAGVNILVQPPGKKVKEIGLLSGGEKALCAMALIFSLFLLNPSPFCVMDEVDAPLDEFSLAAFTGLVGELKGRSQFIV